MPHVYLLFLLVMLLVVGLTYIIPAGEYTKITDPNNASIQKIDVNTFQYVENTDNIGIMEFFSAIHQGMVRGASIIFMLLMISGSLYILEESGAIGAGIEKLIQVAEGKETLIIVFLTVVFAALGAIGFAEGGIPFIPLCVGICMKIGYDPLLVLPLQFLVWLQDLHQDF